MSQEVRNKRRRNFLKGVGAGVVGMIVAYLVSKVRVVEEPVKEISIRLTARGGKT